MAVHRINKIKNYTIMSNYHLRDKDLSLKAKGLLSQMLSLPDEWDYTTEGLIALNKEGERAVKAALAELKDAGYLVVTKLFPNETESGKIEYVYDIFETPQRVHNQEVQNVGVENVGLQNAGQLNTNNKYTENKSTDNKEKRVEKRDSLLEILEENEPTASNEELRNSFVEFIKMRKLIKKPLTEKALMLAINRAYSLAKGDIPTMIKIVDQSVLNSWQGLFEIKEPTAEKRTGGGSKGNDALSQLQALAAEEGIEL